MSDSLRIPDWLKTNGSKLHAARHLSKILEEEVPNSICQEARCPNRSECFAKGVLTFMILGTICTRACAFCSVAHGKPLPPDPHEAETLIRSIKKLNLKFVVLTSPNRDDLPDNGSGHYARVVSAIKEALPDVKVEILIPDFKGNKAHLAIAMASKPDVVNHNLETVPELYRSIRKGSLYQRSLDVLATMKQINPLSLTKTGLMVGLGETVDQLKRTFADIQAVGVDILTLGQYLKPDKTSADVQKYYHPDEFDVLKQLALDGGIRHVFSGPFVRSSFLAESVFDDVLRKVA